MKQGEKEEILTWKRETLIYDKSVYARQCRQRGHKASISSGLWSWKSLGRHMTLVPEYKLRLSRRGVSCEAEQSRADSKSASGAAWER